MIRRPQFSLEDLKFEILKAVRTLTPGTVMECSTNEIAALLREDGIHMETHVLAARLTMLKKQGLLINRKYVQRSLWKLTAQGKRTLADHDRDRRRSKTADTKNS